MTRLELRRRLTSLRAAFLAGELPRWEYRLLRSAAAAAYAELQGYRRAARRRVRTEREAGRLERPRACEACGLEGRPVEADHPDHSQALQVTWLCASCHDAADRELAAGQVPAGVK